MFDRQIPLILQRDDAKQIVRSNPGERKPKGFDRVEGVGLRSLLVDEVVNRRIEFDHVVSVEFLVAVNELQVGVLLWESKLDSFFVL